MDSDLDTTLFSAWISTFSFINEGLLLCSHSSMSSSSNDEGRFKAVGFVIVSLKAQSSASCIPLVESLYFPLWNLISKVKECPHHLLGKAIHHIVNLLIKTFPDRNRLHLNRRFLVMRLDRKSLVELDNLHYLRRWKLTNSEEDYFNIISKTNKQYNIYKKILMLKMWQLTWCPISIHITLKLILK